MEQKILSGNEVLAWSVLEAGVSVAAGYPGTPSTEALATLIKISKDYPIHVEWSTNEKVAFEIAAATSWTGKRSLATMKMSGMNVAQDSIASIAYSGVNGGLVIYVADDPAAHAGMPEQDTRLLAKFLNIPLLDASCPRDMHDLLIFAYELSEKVNAPVILRSTTPVAHSYAPVEIGEYKAIDRIPTFEKDIAKYTKAGSAICITQHKQTLDRLKAANDFIVLNNLNKLQISNNSDLGIIVSGVAVEYVNEIKEKYNLDFSILTVKAPYPYPDKEIKELFNQNKKILVVEELEPFIEEIALQNAYESSYGGKIYGKKDGYFQRYGEYSVESVFSVLERITNESKNKKEKPSFNLAIEAQKKSVKRPITFCPGCPHRGTFLAIEKAAKKLKKKKSDLLVTGDIGCTILGMNPPFNLCQTEVSMGSSIGLAQGFYHSGIDKIIIATIGDSTFFHGGIPQLINAYQHDANITVIILDNEWTAMTGFQVNPGTPYQNEYKAVSIENIVKGIGITPIVVDPYNLDETIDAIYNSIQKEGTKVIIAKRECALQSMRRIGKVGEVKIDPEACIGCMICVNTLACSSLVIDYDIKKVHIDQVTCNGCGLCVEVCPTNAIKKLSG